jgi:two-component system, OmpR family, sensor kinase
VLTTTPAADEGPILDPPTTDLTPPRPGRRDRRSTFGSTRLRIAVTYLLVLIGAAVVSMVAIREVLLLRLDRRTDEALRQEVLEPPLLVDGIDPLTGQPFETLERAFDVYLDRNVPSIEEAFVALVNGVVVRDRLRSFPGQEVPADALETWAAFSRSGSGPDEIEGSYDTSFGTARYRAVRVRIGDDIGAFVVTILPAGELREIRELQTYGAAVIAIVVIVAGVSAWLLAGRVLRPVRELTETARSISESNQADRIRTGGSGEAAEMAETFNDMLDRLNAASVNRRDLVRAAGHELRAPLTVATGHLELLAEGTVDEQTALPLVIDELTRMGKIIDDLQSLTGADAPGFLVPETIDAELLAAELHAKATAIAPRMWLVDEATPGTFVADRFRLTEAVLNLADNAVKHTAEDDTIALGLRIAAGEVRLWVRDTGVGVASADVDRVFQRFIRGQGAHQRYRGAGLGLSIVQSIAVVHGGRVELDSRPGSGATFTIVIPLMTALPTPKDSPDATDPDR